MKENWANSDEDIEANLKWIEDRHQICASLYEKCPHPHCGRGWHGMPEGTPGNRDMNSLYGSHDRYCPGSHTFNSPTTET
jgi:hypothetical protein